MGEIIKMGESIWQLNRALAGIKPSGIRKYFDLVEKNGGIISLGIGEPDFVTPQAIRDAGIDSLQKGKTKYTPNAGLTELRVEISRYLERRFDLSYSYEDQILVTVGGSEAIDLCIRATLNPGDEVLIPEPSFVCYGPLAALSGGVPKPIVTTVEDRFRLTPEALRKAITPKTKMLVLPYPCNPTGGILERQDLEALAEVLKDTSIVVLSDEIYAELTYGVTHASIAQVPSMHERALLIGGFSKPYAMTGWRMGYACGAPSIIAAMTKIHQFGIMSAPTTGQYAAIVAMRDGGHDVDSMHDEYDKRRRFVVEQFNRMGLSCFEPQGAFYAFPDIRSTKLTSEEFCDKLLYEYNVAVIPGNAFGACGEGFIRCCYASTMEKLEMAMQRIDAMLQNLR